MEEVRKRKWFRRSAAVVAGVFVLAVIEAALRLSGVAGPGVPARELFVKSKPVFERRGDAYQTDNKFFVAQSFSADKNPDTTRIFITGGSAAMGFPFESDFSPAVLLKAGLEACLPGRSFEVINAGGFGFSSPRVVGVVREVLAYQPDVVVVMTGNNEFLERRFVETGVVGVLSRLRLFRLIEGLVFASRDDAADVKWEAHVVSGPEREAVYADLAKNLAAIAARCQEKGVPLILVTCPSNLRNFRPYGPSAVPLPEQEKIDEELAHDPAAADSLLRAFLAKFPDDAWAHFERGALLFDRSWPPVGERKASLEEADGFFKRARDLDPMPVRATSAVNRAVMAAAGAPGAVLADAAGVFDDFFAGKVNSGKRVFFDHCHLQKDGQEMLSAEIMAALGRTGTVELGPGWRERASAEWDKLHAAVFPASLARALYRIGYESGVNMGRVHRGLRCADMALAFDPAHAKAESLRGLLEPEAARVRELTGD